MLRTERDTTDDAARAGQHARIELLARRVVVLLGVVQRTQRAQLAGRQRRVVEQHRRGDERPGETAPPGLVGAGDEPHRQSPVEGEQAVADSRAAGPSAERRSRALEEADPVGRPVGGERCSDDPCSGDRSPEPAVVGEVTVVAHHEVVTGRNLDRRRIVAVAVCSWQPAKLANGSCWRLPLRIT